MIIKIEIKNKIARTIDANSFIVCNNDDYELEFAFDEEWAGYNAKTAYFVAGKKTLPPVQFKGNKCPVPRVTNATVLSVGLSAGDLRTTTDAAITCRKSIRCKCGAPEAPKTEVYDEIMAKLNDGSLKGEKGDKGDKGEQGEQGLQGVAGQDGKDGKDGVNGKDGISAYEVAKANGFEGTEKEWIASLKGERGEQGLQGLQGERGFQGERGEKGAKGDKGDTPQKGVDYWTDSDKREITDYVDKKIIGATKLYLHKVLCQQYAGGTVYLTFISSRATKSTYDYYDIELVEFPEDSFDRRYNGNVLIGMMQETFGSHRVWYFSKTGEVVEVMADITADNYTVTAL